MKRHMRLSRGGFVLLAITAGCQGADGAANDVLPGHSRPVLEHDWVHPRNLTFEANRFQPPDPAAHLMVLPGGLRVFFMPDSLDTVVQVLAAVPAGRLRESAGETGTSDAIARALTQRLQEGLPAQFVARTAVDQSADVTRVSVQTLPEDWRTALSALIGALRAPVEVASAPAGGGRRGGGARGGGARGGGGGGRGGGAGRPVAELQRLFASATGTPAPPAAPGAVQSLAARSLDAGSVVLAIAGPVARADVDGLLGQLTAGWQTRQSAPGVTVGEPGFVNRPVTDPLILIDEPSTTVYGAVGHAMPPIEAADEPALAVLAEILNLRLNIAVREVRGLSNRALLDMPRSRRDAGVLAVRGGARPEAVAPMLHFSLEELTRIRSTEGAPTEDELAQAKGGLSLGSWQGSLESARGASATYAMETVRWGSLERLNDWPAAVNAVTADAVLAAARKYIQPQEFVAVVVGPLEVIRKARHPRWPVTLEDLRPKLRRAG